MIISENWVTDFAFAISFVTHVISFRAERYDEINCFFLENYCKIHLQIDIWETKETRDHFLINDVSFFWQRTVTYVSIQLIGLISKRFVIPIAKKKNILSVELIFMNDFEWEYSRTPRKWFQSDDISSSIRYHDNLRGIISNHILESLRTKIYVWLRCRSWVIIAVKSKRTELHRASIQKQCRLFAESR